MSKKKRSMEIFSLSFMDCICCGFGAIILLFVLSKVSEPVVIEEVSEDLSGILQKLEEELHEIRGEVAVMNREMESKKEQLSEEKDKLARLQGDLSEVLGEFESSQQDSSVQNSIEGTMAKAAQSLTEEMKRLYAQQKPKAKPKESVIGGIPIDSEYIIFIIDTSGSMFNYCWPMVIKKFEETLEVYPKVKGIQVMNDMGEYMFTGYKNRWIPDGPRLRGEIVKRLTTWNAFSNSSPVEGIQRAVKTYYKPGTKISIYVFGDEFMGGSVQSVIDYVDRINKIGEGGQRMVRIHGVGFPIQFSRPDGIDATGIRFATLMRALCHRNGGTFVGLNSHTP